VAHRTPRRQQLLDRLAGTGIPVVHQVACRSFASSEELLQLLSTATSAYCTTPTPAEGLYLRVEAGGKLLRRAKIVRPGFLQVLLPSLLSGFQVFIAELCLKLERDHVPRRCNSYPSV
jgi:hypothetical protein